MQVLFWILKQNGKKFLKPQGPYTQDQVANLLKSGVCSDRDFVWTPGFKGWKKISLMEEFATHPGHTIEDILLQQAQKYQAHQTQKPKSLRVYLGR